MDTIDVSVVIPANLSHTGATERRTKPIDGPVAEIVSRLNHPAHGDEPFTVASCAHGTPEIVLADGRVLVVYADRAQADRAVSGGAYPAPSQLTPLQALLKQAGVSYAVAELGCQPLVDALQFAQHMETYGADCRRRALQDQASVDESTRTRTGSEGGVASTRARAWAARDTADFIEDKLSFYNLAGKLG
jgi:hypothetical protein